MSENVPQNLKNHARFDPYYHGLLFGILLLNLVYASMHLFHHHTIGAAWFLVLSLAAFVFFFKLRLYPLKVQDRLIRLEERLRLQALAPAEWNEQLNRLSEDQLIGLRFASDEEVVALAHQALEQHLNRVQIKARIRTWRPDTFRV